MSSRSSALTSTPCTASLPTFTRYIDYPSTMTSEESFDYRASPVGRLDSRLYSHLQDHPHTTQSFSGISPYQPPYQLQHIPDVYSNCYSPSGGVAVSTIAPVPSNIQTVYNTAYGPSHHMLNASFFSTSAFKMSGLDYHLRARISNVMLIKVGLLTTSMDGVIGVVAAALSLVTRGYFDKLNHSAKAHLNSFSLILSSPFLNILRTLNPTAEITNDTLIKGTEGHVVVRGVYYGSNKDHPYGGIYTGRTIQWFRNIAENMAAYDSILVSHVGSRIVYLASIVAGIATRCLDAVVGSVAAVISLLNWGLWTPKANDYAYQGLQITGVVGDVYYAASKFIYPWTNIRD